MLSITMPRGDIRPVSFTLTGGTPGEEIKIDEIYFTVKTSYTAQDYLFQKRLSDGNIEFIEDGHYQFVINANDTDNLKIGRYVFDIEVVGPGLKQTFVGELTLTNEVTFASNEGWI